MYSFTMNSKHLFCFQAPVFLVYMLCTYCISSSKQFQWNHFIQLGLIVLSDTFYLFFSSLVFFVSLFPVLRGDVSNNIHQFLSRLFPFQRGIIHSYWAPNIWAIYAGIDRVLASVVTHLCHGYDLFCRIPVKSSNTANGIVKVASFSVLPEIPSIITILLMLGSYIVLSLSSVHN